MRVSDKVRAGPVGPVWWNLANTVLRGAGGCLDEVRSTQQPVVVQCELFTGGQLALAGVAREARQMVHVVARLAHPVGGAEHSLALGTLERHRSAHTHAHTHTHTHTSCSAPTDAADRRRVDLQRWRYVDNIFSVEFHRPLTL